MSRSPSRRPRGFTLAELLIGLVVTSITLAAVTAIFIGVQRTYQLQTENRNGAEGARSALTFLKRTVSLAGYGIDPRTGVHLPAPASDLDNTDVAALYPTPSLGAAPVISDVLSFRYRDPAFLVRGRLSSATQITLDPTTPLPVGLNDGRLVMVGCQGGNDFALFRLSGGAAVGTTNLTLSATIPPPWVANSAACLSGTGINQPFVFLVQEHRIRVVNIGGRPWLVSFRNLDGGTNPAVDEYDPIAADVENFQVAYVMNRARLGLGCCQTAPDTGANFIFGDTAGEAIFTNPAGLLATSPRYDTPYDDPTRYGAHPANVRGVEIALIVRSPRQAEDTRAPWINTLFNWTGAAPATDGFRRIVLHTSIPTTNLLSRTSFVPTLRSSADLRDLNSWGG